MIQTDIKATETSISALAQCLAAIQPYWQAMEAIPLGPLPIVINGQPSGSWDPFSNAPAIRSALQTAQQHCCFFTNDVVTPLNNMPAIIAYTAGSTDNPGILNDLAVMNTVITALSSGAVPTDAQRQSFNGALADIVSQVNSLQDGLFGMQSGAATFQNNMSSDVQMLSNGDQSVSVAIIQLKNNYVAACEEFMHAGGQPIIDILTSIFNQMNTYLVNIQTGITNSLSAEATVVPALSGLQNLFAGMYTSYNNVYNEASSASSAAFNSVIQQIDISVLQQYWQDLVTYTAANGFGMAPVL